MSLWNLKIADDATQLIMIRDCNNTGIVNTRVTKRKTVNTKVMTLLTFFYKIKYKKYVSFI